MTYSCVECEASYPIEPTGCLRCGGRRLVGVEEVPEMSGLNIFQCALHGVTSCPCPQCPAPMDGEDPTAYQERRLWILGLTYNYVARQVVGLPPLDPPLPGPTDSARAAPPDDPAPDVPAESWRQREPLL